MKRLLTPVLFCFLFFFIKTKSELWKFKLFKKKNQYFWNWSVTKEERWIEYVTTRIHNRWLPLLYMQTKLHIKTQFATTLKIMAIGFRWSKLWSGNNNSCGRICIYRSTFLKSLWQEFQFYIQESNILKRSQESNIWQVRNKQNTSYMLFNVW